MFMIQKEKYKRFNYLVITILLFLCIFFFYSYINTKNEIENISNMNNKISSQLGEMKQIIQKQSTVINTVTPTTKVVENLLPDKFKPFLKSQSGQDKYMYENFFWNKNTPGIYVEFGARDGKEHSNTYFYEFALGWTGLLVEFEDVEFNKLVKNRVGSIVLQGAVCKEHKLKEFAISKNGGWHGDPQLYPEHRKPLLGKKVTVKCYTLNELLTESGIRYIDYMSIDTEGSEYSIIEAFDFNLFVVDVIQIEVLMGEIVLKKKIHDLMLSKGYDHIIDYVVTPKDTWDLIYKRNVRVDMFKIEEIKKNGWPKTLTDTLTFSDIS